MPKEFQALWFIMADALGDLSPALKYFIISEYYEKSVKGNGPSFLGKLNRTELLGSMIIYDGQLRNDENPNNDNNAVLVYLLMTDGVAHPRFGVDEASFHHDQYGPRVLDSRNRRANTKWIARANREVFSHDSWSRIHKREYKATPKSWGRLRGLVAAINTAFSWIGQAIMALTGTVLFSLANALNGTKNLGNMKKWRL